PEMPWRDGAGAAGRNGRTRFGSAGRPPPLPRNAKENVMTSIHRLALLKAAIAVGALRVAPGVITGHSMERAATGALIPMRPDSRGGQ
ncbi:hypothetical protein SIN09_38420, partial [Streptomyces sp. F8]|uniref:hypothetical protein n=1 Tax=Streptomyces sp. F8 TaxID=1436085 RepID=UPI0029D1EB1C